MTNKVGQSNLATSLTISNGNVSSSKDHMTSPEAYNKEEAAMTDLNSTSEVSTESDLICTQSCSALPDKDNREYDQDFPQSISAPELPEKHETKPVQPELSQNPILLQVDQKRPGSTQEEPSKPALPQQDQDEPVSRELPLEKCVKSQPSQNVPAEPESPLVKPGMFQPVQKHHLTTCDGLEEDGKTPESPLRDQKEPIKLKSPLGTREGPVLVESSQQIQEESGRADKTEQDLEEGESSEGNEKRVEPVKPQLPERDKQQHCIDLEEEIKLESPWQCHGESVNLEIPRKDHDRQQLSQKDRNEQIEPAKQFEGVEELTENKRGENDIISSNDNPSLSDRGEDGASPTANVQQTAMLASGQQSEIDTHQPSETAITHNVLAAEQFSSSSQVTTGASGGTETAAAESENADHSKMLSATKGSCARQEDESQPLGSRSPLKEGREKKYGLVDTSQQLSDPFISENGGPHTSPGELHPPVNGPCTSLKNPSSTSEENSLLIMPVLSIPTSSEAIPLKTEYLEATDCLSMVDEQPSHPVRPDPPPLETSTKAESSTPTDSCLTSDRADTETMPQEPPWSPGAKELADDIKDLLTVVQAPLAPDQLVRVPSISRNNRYYRVSVKGSTPRSSRHGPENEEGRSKTCVVRHFSGSFFDS